MFKQIVMGVLAALVFCQAFAVGPEVAHLQREWAEIKYKQPRDAQEHLFAGLLEVAEEYAAKAPSDPEVLIWYGIVESSYASARGGLGALEHVKNAKKALEKVIETNPLALDGSALTSLGSLYYQVPGWPIGFGDDKKAIEYLKKGLAANPDGMDSNFFYG
ncbi:MAG TPA: hypothetical protein VJU83_12905, partial [Burkholderiales bacterium]|nr:hypothetical protein [Burkholderiales bacterium]